MDKTCILIVDDNPEIREIINVLLGGEGFEVSEAENGAQALTLIEQQDFDLIILDIMMPGPNGYQTCRKIRELSNAPILFLSARTKESDKTLGFSSGGDDYLAKPFSYNELISRSKAFDSALPGIQREKMKAAIKVSIVLLLIRLLNQ